MQDRYCSLSIDGLSTTKKILYDEVNSKHTGFVDHGDILVEDKETSSSKALAFILRDHK